MNVVTMLRQHPPVEIDPKEARQIWRAFRLEHHVYPGAPLLTAPTGNAKIARSGRYDMSLSLAPAKTSGHNVCPWSTPACRAGCVAFVGHGGIPSHIPGRSVTERRSLRVKFLVEHRDAFCTLVRHELYLGFYKFNTGRACPDWQPIGCRFNAFSDIPWEEVAPWMLTFPTLHSGKSYVQAYDYTKNYDRKPPDNYHLVYSCRDNSIEEDDRIVKRLWEQENVAIVFHVLYRPNAHKQDPLPNDYLGFPVIDGDHDDTRYLDPRGVIVGLRCKGKQLFNNPGRFVRRDFRISFT